MSSVSRAADTTSTRDQGNDKKSLDDFLREASDSVASYRGRNATKHSCAAAQLAT